MLYTKVNVKHSCSCRYYLDENNPVLWAGDQFRPCKGIRIPGSGKILLIESGIQLKESGILLRIGIQNPSSNDKDWNQVPGNPESTTWNPESKSEDCLGFPYIGRMNCL